MNGPVAGDVNAILMPFHAGYFDGTDDSYKYQETPFSRVVGSVESLFAERSLSDDLVSRCIDEAFERDAGNLVGVEKPDADDYLCGRTRSIAVPHIGDMLEDLVQEQISDTPGTPTASTRRDTPKPCGTAPCPGQ